MGREYFLEMSSREEGKSRLGLPQHFGDIRVLGIFAQAQFSGEKLPEGWDVVKEHISSCEECQYEISDITAALQVEEEAMLDYLGLNNQ